MARTAAAATGVFQGSATAAATTAVIAAAATATAYRNSTRATVTARPSMSERAGEAGVRIRAARRAAAAARRLLAGAAAATCLLLGFLGPNGAGKTTTLEIVEGIREPTSGRATVLGLDSVSQREDVKRRIGVQLQAAAYFDYLTLDEILELFGSFYPVRRDPGELLDRVGLLEKRGAQVRHLSGGQARRFSVVAALVNDPGGRVPGRADDRA